MSLNGTPEGPPLKSGLALGDYWDGLNAYAAVMSAWFHRLRTGEGQHIDASLLQNLVYHNSAVLDSNIGVYTTRNGNDSPYYSPYGLFRASSGRYAVVCVQTDDEWKALSRLMGCNTAGLETNELRIRERERVTVLLEEWLASFDDVMDAVRKMEQAGIVCCRMTEMRDMMSDPHYLSQNWIVEADLPDDITTMRRWYVRGPNAFFSKTPGNIKKAPVLGDSNYQILEEIGLSREDVDRLQTKWVSGA
jgi:crotonobetainyl-CoA:carnitine CoA-transferase CaiB-like acyl-CoA transferase